MTARRIVPIEESYVDDNTVALGSPHSSDLPVLADACGRRKAAGDPPSVTPMHSAMKSLDGAWRHASSRTFGYSTPAAAMSPSTWPIEACRFLAVLRPVGGRVEPTTVF